MTSVVPAVPGRSLPDGDGNRFHKHTRPAALGPGSQDELPSFGGSSNVRYLSSETLSATAFGLREGGLGAQTCSPNLVSPQKEFWVENTNSHCPSSPTGPLSRLCCALCLVLQQSRMKQNAPEFSRFPILPFFVVVLFFKFYLLI